MANSRWFDYGFLAFGLFVQVVTFYFSNTFQGVEIGYISLVSGCLGICSVCLTAQGNILTYVFGFGQVVTYTYLCVSQRFYGEIAINGYYFITMIYGVYAWKRRLKSQAGSSESKRLVSPRNLSQRAVIIIALVTILFSWLSGKGLASWTDDTQPYLDAFTTIPALVAQVLMILVYREHWFIWLAVDSLCVVLWLRAGDYCMAAQYAFWCANCLYGLHRWRSLGISKE